MAIEDVLKACQLHFLSVPNVVGVGLGYKVVGGQQTDILSISVLVSRKLPANELERHYLIPRQVGDAPTDVLEVGELRLLHDLDRRARLRPVRPGVSIAHYRVSAGTLGAVVYDRRTRASLLLSNNHVLANITDGSDGRAQVGDPILQPGRYDGGTQSDVVARLERFVPIHRAAVEPSCRVAKAVEGMLNRLVGRVAPRYQLRLFRVTRAANLVDAAVARPLTSDLVDPDILEVGVPRGTTEPRIGMEVLKSGRTSGVTRGRIQVIRATVRVFMGELGWAYFSEQMVTTALAEPGDSGSLVLNHRLEAVGLVGAGSQQATVCSTITNVCRLLAVVL